jgi:hypothetical protein
MPYGKRLAAAALLIVLGAVANAQEAAQRNAVAGAGSQTCAQMATDIRELPNVARGYISWMQGYMSGVNAARQAQGLSLANLSDYENQWVELRKWCQAHPSARVWQGVDELYRTLSTQ